MSINIINNQELRFSSKYVLCNKSNCTCEKKTLIFNKNFSFGFKQLKIKFPHNGHVLLTTTPVILSFFLFHILDGTVNQIEGKAAVGTDGILFTPYFFILKMIHHYLLSSNTVNNPPWLGYSLM